MLGSKIQLPTNSDLALISEKLRLKLSKEIEFYRNLSRKCGDYNAEFIETEKDTSSGLITIEINANEGPFLWLGKNNFAKFNTLHDAVAAFFLAHHAFKVKIDSRSANLHTFFCKRFGWPFKCEETTVVKKLLASL